MRLTVLSHTYIVRLNRGKLACLVGDHGIELQVVVPTHWSDGDLRRVLRAEMAEGEPYRLETLPFGGSRRPALMRYPLGALLRGVRAFAPDLVHVEEEPWSVAALQATFVARAAHAPLTLFTWENIDRRLPPPFGLINRFVLRQVEHLLVGNRDAEAIARRRGYRGPATLTPQLGVSSELFRPRTGGVRSDEDCGQLDGSGHGPQSSAAAPSIPSRCTRSGPRDAQVLVGFVGRLVASKGVEVLMEAFGRLPQGYHLRFVGDGPLAATLGEQAAARGWAGRIDFTGTVTHAHVARHLRELDVLVLPSLTTASWREQFGHVLVEAMASGVPVIGSDSGAIPEVIGDAGMVVPESDAGALASALTELADPRCREELARRGRERVQARFTDQAVARLMAEVCANVPRRTRDRAEPAERTAERG